MEEKTNSIDFLQKKVSESIEIIKSKEKKNKAMVGALGISSASLSAFITMTLGFDIDGFEHIQKNIALALGAALTIVNSWILLFNYKKSWIRQKKTLLNLYQLKNRIEFSLTSPKTEGETPDHLFSLYLEIWERDNGDWENIYNKKHSEHKE